MAAFNGNKRNNHIIGTADPDSIDGRGGNDLLQGLGGIDFIFGNTGNDVIEGGAGGDTLDGFTGIDTLSYANSDVGVAIVLGADGATFSASGGHATGDAGFGFENITGSAFEDGLEGNDFRNVLNGGGGSDLLNGRGGKDTVIGGAGDDTLRGGTGADVLNGGADEDEVDFGDSTSGVTVILGKNGAETIGKGGEAQGDRISKVEDIYSSPYADRLTGNNLANEMRGNGGNDRLNGGGGNDALLGGADNDRLTGGKGDDDMFGGPGGGNDTYVFGRGFGHDTIFDFVGGLGLSDVIRLDREIFKSFTSVLAASAQVGTDVVITKDADNTITLKNVMLINLSADDFTFF